MKRGLLFIASLLAAVVAYALVARAISRPDILPPLEDIGDAFTALLGPGIRTTPAVDASTPVPVGEAPHQHHHHHTSDQVETLKQEGVTLQAALGVTFARVLFGLAAGLPLGILIGLILGASRRTDDYLHPLYILLRSVPPLALITYIMLWLGHSEAHRLIPIVYAVAVTAVIPTYHGVRDVAAKYLIAARSLGARGTFLVTRVALPAAMPALVSGVRYSIAIAWMTAVGAEMLMADNGMGNLLVGGGMWSTRLQTRSDPAVIMVGIVALGVAGWAMDAVASSASARLTRWAR
ncbi:MAG TPA: ABC transporter permease subunit [Myxococcales bacterium]|nr:ABC transporter permease subunit [Myxococcales bacterium]